MVQETERGEDVLDLSGIDSLLEAAGPIALRLFRTAIVADDKGSDVGYDPVTEADRGIEDFLRGAARRAVRRPRDRRRGDRYERDAWPLSAG